jgi:hypothetical protein
MRLSCRCCGWLVDPVMKAHAVFAMVFGLLRLENLETACSHADY